MVDQQELKTVKFSDVYEVNFSYYPYEEVLGG